MQLKYLRITVFNFLLRPFSDWSRKGRMRRFIMQMGLREETKVLDLGGHPRIWRSIPFALDLTVLNLPGVAVVDPATHHRICYVEGDACHVGGFEEQSFEVVFSNSVIEHVGSFEKRAALAREVRRLGKSYWVQTPSKWFPIEAHCGMPFWWFYPPSVRRFFIARWRKKLPAWTQMVAETTVLTKSELRRLFPEATIESEWFLGLPKSYVAYFVGNRES